MTPAKRSLQVIAAVGVLVLFGLALGCNGFFVDPTLTSVVVSPTSASIGIKKTIQMTAFGTYDDGSRKQIKSGLVWSTSDSTIASIDPNSGIATAVAVGSATITGEAQGLSGTGTITVVPSGITSIIVKPVSASIKQGTTQQFTATAQDGTDVTSIVTWASNDTTDVTITNGSGGTGGGLASSISTITTNVTVTISASLQTDTGTVQSTATLIVTP
jgi:thiamine pyrophosphokinase